ncbi:hypothetical protein RG903_01780 [Thermithiobacillus tepidarius DSM 3134]|uniref:hypothetical protein n=1 Tax=Thermithiobacillus tepidarius TaxID=929 RepID=UPI00041D1EDA|nr:hypothetical protein [Thermithiobacillus tepidarius]
MDKTVVALFDSRTEAENAIQALMREGFRPDDVSVVMYGADGETREYGPELSDGDKAGMAGLGAAFGSLIGILAGVTALAIPGLGPIVAMGPLAAVLTGAGVGAVAGGLIGALTAGGVAEDEARHYEEAVRRGGTLVTIRNPGDRIELARSIMQRHGSVDIRERVAQWRTQGTTAAGGIAQPLPQGRTRPSPGARPATGAAGIRYMDQAKVGWPGSERRLQADRRQGSGQSGQAAIWTGAERRVADRRSAGVNTFSG